jgi:hypothetical protein
MDSQGVKGVTTQVVRNIFLSSSPDDVMLYGTAVVVAVVVVGRLSHLRRRKSVALFVSGSSQTDKSR